MKINLRLTRKGRSLYDGTHEVTDAASFGKAFAEVWLAVQAQKMMTTTSVGQLMEEINDDVLDDLNGAQITLAKVPSAEK